VVASRFDPFRDLDRLAERMLASAVDMGQAVRAMPIDLYREGDHWVLNCDLPGADPGSIDVGVDGRVLTIRGQRTPSGDAAEWLAQERPTGMFARQLTLGNAVDLDNIQATYANGVLSLTLPVAEAAKPRRIQVSTAETADKSVAIESSAGS
jgi:HSP20 family protein